MVPILISFVFKVEAVLKKDGGAVTYPESVVYRDEAIVPVGVIIYDLIHGGTIND